MSPKETPRRSRSWSGWQLAGAVVVTAAMPLGACSGDDSQPATAASGAGAEIYEQSCASCHGSDLRGTDRGPSHLSQVYAPDHHPDASFRAAIISGARAHHWGFGDMPPVEGLSDDEIEVVIAYVRDQQQAHGLEPYPPR